jgi:two-component sensor histidine kinase
MSELYVGQGAGGQGAGGQAAAGQGAGQAAKAQRGVGWALIDALAKQLGTTPEVTRQGGTRVALCFDDRVDGTES